MKDIRSTLSIIWIAVMLTYLLGDVIGIFAGDFVPGEIGGAKFTQGMGLGIAALMVTPILMVVRQMHKVSNRKPNYIVQKKEQ